MTARGIAALRDHQIEGLRSHVLDVGAGGVEVRVVRDHVLRLSKDREKTKEAARDYALLLLGVFRTCEPAFEPMKVPLVGSMNETFMIPIDSGFQFSR